MATIILKSGREKSLLRRHPWVFSGAIDRLEGGPAARGETVAVQAASGEALGWGAYSPQSQIAVRLWSFDPGDEIGAPFLERRLRAALAARDELHARTDLDAYRLVNAESDGLPGLIVDRYGQYLAVQCLSAGADYWKRQLVHMLVEIATEHIGPVLGAYERSDADVRAKEGLEPEVGVLAGDALPEQIAILENGSRFLVQPALGHKTGFYLDQRYNRALLAQYAAGTEVLNGFAYTGAFGVYALRGGAVRVTNVDTSGSALELARENVVANGLEADRVENITGDMFYVLRSFRDARRQFDLIVLDPPKFADSRSQLEGAARGYKDINLLAFKLLRPGGILFTFSCSGLVSRDLFQKIVASAAADSGREVQALRWLSQASDHPVALAFPEGEYLKGLVCRVSY
jgi:23S rRNA (cytosine1962-C5)-methyltransferase